MRYMQSAAIAPSGAVMGMQHLVVDTADLRVLQRLPKSHHIVAFAADGATLVAEDDSSWSDEVLHIYARKGGSYNKTATLNVEDRDGAPAIAPDGRTVAVRTDEAVLLHDAGTGKLVQRIKGDFDHVSFFADSAGLICSTTSDNRAKVLHGDGREVRLPACSAVVFTLDGRTAARFGYKGVVLGPVDNVLGNRSSRYLGPSDKSWRVPAFSPDGRWLAACNYSDDTIVVIDARDRQVAFKLRNPGRPRERVGSVRSIGFSADSTRLLVACDVHFNRFAEDDEDCVAVYRMADGAFLGAILLSRNERRPTVVAASGVFGDIRDADRPKAGKQADKAGGWWHPQVAGRVICGTAEGELLSERMRAQLADIEARWAYLHDLQAAKTLDGQAAIPALIDATRGVTHVLDLVVRNARQAQADTPTFGGGSKALALTGDQLAEAAAALRERPADELRVLHEQLIEQAEASEAERARRIAGKAGKSGRKKRSGAASKGPREPRSVQQAIERANFGSVDVFNDGAADGSGDGGGVPVKVVVVAVVIAALIAWFVARV